MLQYIYQVLIHISVKKQFGYVRLEGKETIRGALADNNYYCIKNKLTCAGTLLLFFQPVFQLPVTPPGGQSLTL